MKSLFEALSLNSSLREQLLALVREELLKLNNLFATVQLRSGKEVRGRLVVAECVHWSVMLVSYETAMPSISWVDLHDIAQINLDKEQV